MKIPKNFGNKFAGKGYYIALILCAVAIGISGYLFYRNTNSANPAAPTDDPGLNLVDPTGHNQQVIATQPGDKTNPTDPSDPTNPTVDPKPKPLQTARPLQGQVVMDYCMDCLGYNPTTRDWRTHDGMDFAAEAGTAVCAAASGTVYTIYTDEAMGTTVVIRHDGGYVTTYASLDEEVAVSVGDSVALGQTIGYVGASALLESAIGDHVHFSVTLNGKTVDPEAFLALN